MRNGRSPPRSLSRGLGANAPEPVNLDTIFEQSVVKGHPAADHGWKGIVARNDVMTSPRQMDGGG
jgi:hypothetical protein